MFSNAQRSGWTKRRRMSVALSPWPAGRLLFAAELGIRGWYGKSAREGDTVVERGTMKVQPATLTHHRLLQEREPNT